MSFIRIQVKCILLLLPLVCEVQTISIVVFWLLLTTFWLHFRNIIYYLLSVGRSDSNHYQAIFSIRSFQDILIFRSFSGWSRNIIFNQFNLKVFKSFLFFQNISSTRVLKYRVSFSSINHFHIFQIFFASFSPIIQISFLLPPKTVMFSSNPLSA